MKRLVINADDYNLTKGCDRAIEECMAAGAITSASCMVWDARIELPAVMVGRTGLHLRLTSGVPVSKVSAVPSLVGRDGKFAASREGVVIRCVEPREVRREWYEQRALLAGQRVLTHMDTHHHVHAITDIDKVYADHCAAYGCAGVPLSTAQRDLLRKIRVPCADFAEIRWVDGKFGTLRKLLAEDFAHHETVHLMTHPGFVDEELLRVSGMATVRRWEFYTLMDAEFASWLANEGIQKIGMADL